MVEMAYRPTIIEPTTNRRKSRSPLRVTEHRKGRDVEEENVKSEILKDLVLCNLNLFHSSTSEHANHIYGTGNEFSRDSYNETISELCKEGDIYSTMTLLSQMEALSVFDDEVVFVLGLDMFMKSCMSVSSQRSTLHWRIQFSGYRFWMSSFLLSCMLIFVTINGKILSQSKKPPLPPSPFSWPIVGNLPKVYANKPVFKWVDGVMEKLKTNIGCIRLGRVHVIVVVSPELSREFLHKHDSLFMSRPITMATEYASQGFLTTGLSPWGEQWKKMKRIVNQELFSPTRLRWLLNKRNKETDNLVYYIFKRCNNPDGSVINLSLPIKHYGPNVIRKMTFSRRFFGEGGENGGPDIDGHENNVRNSMNVFDKYHDPIIEARIKQWEDGKRKEAEDLLDIMITLKDKSGKQLLSINEIKAQCSEFFFGVDGPAAGAEWALAEMINQPEILQKTVEEIDRVEGKDRWIQESDVHQLNYLKA
ncbi:isoleucine N-monooxygenase 2-like [Olea europaea var. sylvestris]|uniref:isoleucine N-monooxygenase 2-like n=1 Tax=Olea europaea var. sylvestris TaxID=158386 RepID=UPI000C1D1B1F|nr:isoleucine N-monooxygenase 2-like [Olea europaea var. sylvestris]